MKILLVVFSLVLGSWTAFGAETAYGALRLIGKKSGAESLNHVVEVRGRGGSPAPAVWKVVLEDSHARGGVREMDVQGGNIIAERTPAKRALGERMNFNQLNLDSEGAFSIGNKEAEKSGVAFDRVDYLLKSGSGGGAPVWELQLFHTGDGQVGTVEIAADNGNVLAATFTKAHGNAVARNDAESDREFLRNQSEPNRETRRVEEEDQGKEPIRDVPSLMRRAKRHFDRRGSQIKRFFTGEG